MTEHDFSSGFDPAVHGQFSPQEHGEFDPSTHGQFDPNAHGAFDPNSHGPFDPNRHGYFEPTTHGEFHPQVHGDFNPQTHNQFDPNAHGHYHPELHGNFHPEVHGEFHPQVHGNFDPNAHGPFDPNAHGYYQPGVHGEFHPQVHGEFAPHVHGNFHPELHGNFHPQVHGNFDPTAHGPFDPNAHGYYQPGVHGEFHPQVHGEFAPHVHGNFHPELHGNFHPEVHGTFDPQVHGEHDAALHGPHDPAVHGEHGAASTITADGEQTVDFTDATPVRPTQEGIGRAQEEAEHDNASEQARIGQNRASVMTAADQRLDRLIQTTEDAIQTFCTDARQQIRGIAHPPEEASAIELFAVAARIVASFAGPEGAAAAEVVSLTIDAFSAAASAITEKQQQVAAEHVEDAVARLSGQLDALAEGARAGAVAARDRISGGLHAAVEAYAATPDGHQALSTYSDQTEEVILGRLGIPDQAAVHARYRQVLEPLESQLGTLIAQFRNEAVQGDTNFAAGMREANVEGAHNEAEARTDQATRARTG